MQDQLNHLLDQVAISDVIHRERLARDSGAWDEMASLYHPDASIDVSWFQGSGADFVEATRKAIRPGVLNFHMMSPTVVSVRGDRALAETPTALQAFMQFDGLDIIGTSFLRQLWRAQRTGGDWLIAGLRGIYIRDQMSPCDTGQVLKLDEAKLRSFRQSYRYLSYRLAALGMNPRDDLPGVDRPETVAAVRAAELQWLDAG